MKRKTKTFIGVLALSSLLALPGAAFAQGDPTGDTYGGLAGQQQVAGGGGDNGGGGPTGTSPVSASTPDTGSDSGSNSGSGSLPFTGLQLGLAAIVGLGLLGTGLVLRWATRPRAQLS